MKQIVTKHGNLDLPNFLPDATYGSINSVSFLDAIESGVEGIVTTTLHLETYLGSEYIKKYGGLHKFFNWNKPILTDSGGFQVFSLINASQNKENKITDDGAVFKNPINGSVINLTPEKSQEIQFNLDSDIRIVLDEPNYPDVDKKKLEESVQRTTYWAKRSKEKFLELHKLTEDDFNNKTIQRPLLFAVVQGGGSKELREKSFTELHDIGFDGYCWGGWPVDKNGNLDEQTAKLIPELVGPDKISYAMGVGTPDDIAKCIKYGWQLFDCVLPTRNARHGYLYSEKSLGDADFEHYSVIHIKNEQYKFDETPVWKNAGIELLENTKKSYLRHLIRIKESSGMRIATINNLLFYSKFIKGF